MRWLPVALALVVAGPLTVGLLSLDFRPRPLLADEIPNPRGSEGRIVEGSPVEVLLRSPRPDVTAISFPVVVPADGEPLEVVVRDESEVVGQATIRESGRARITVTDRSLPVVRVRFSSTAGDPERAPRVLWSAVEPFWPVRVSQAGHEVRRIPILRVEHRWPSRAALVVWLVVACAGALAWRTTRALPLFVLALGIACTISSTLLWQADYTLEHFGQWDADRYGAYAERLASLVTDAGTREAAREWIGRYPHAHNALGPAILAVPIALGVAREVAYGCLSSLCGGLALWLACRLLWTRLGLSHRVAMTGLLLFACHMLHLRTFSRPITDELGLVLVLWMLDLLLVRLERVSPAQTAALATLVLLHPLARPQGFAYAGFLIAAVLACDAYRTGGLRWGPTLRALAWVAVAPLGLLGLFYIGFDWSGNFRLALEKADRFREWNTPGLFLTSLVGFVQVLPLFWLRARRAGRAPAAALLAIWGIFCVLLLIAVRAPFWMRHLLPALPVLVAWTGLGIEGASERARRWLLLAAVSVAVVNVAFVLYLVLRPDEMAFTEYLVFG